MVVYVDVGTETGVSEGFVFTVYKPGELIDDHDDFSDRELQLPNEFLGYLIVVSAGQKISAGIISSNVKEIRVGAAIKTASE